MISTRTSAIDLGGRWLLLLLLIAYTLYNLGPIFWLIISSLKSRVRPVLDAAKADLHT